MIRYLTRPHAATFTSFASAALAAVLGLGLAGDSVAQGPEGLKARGPIDRLTNYPAWYEDHHGVKLRLCINPAHCFFGVPDPTRPPKVPSGPGDTDTNFPDESFYYACETSLAGSAANRAVAIFVLALEAGYGNEEVIYGQEIVWVRTRIQCRNLRPFESYTFTHPFGVETHEADGDGRVFVTRDIGRIVGDFDIALEGEIGPFLMPVGVDPLQLQPGEYLIENLVQTEVTGSPFNTNYFMVEGTAVDEMFTASADLTDAFPDRAVSNLFTVQGQIADRHSVGHVKSYYTRDSQATSLDVHAFSSPGQTILLQLASGERVRLDERIGTGGYHAKVNLGQGALPPTGFTLLNVDDAPVSWLDVNQVPPLVTIRRAAYAVDQSLLIEGTSSDSIDMASLPLFGSGLPENLSLLYDTPGRFSLSAARVGGVPASVELVDPADLVSHVARVQVGGANSVETTQPVVANAGPDLGGNVGDTIVLDGSRTTGEGPKTYSWIQTSGQPVVFVQDPTNPAIVSFVAPPLLNDADGVNTYTFRLTVNGTTSDDVILTITDPLTVFDEVRIELAQYDARRRMWRIFGRNTLDEGQTVTIYLAGPNFDENTDPATWDRSRPVIVIPVGGEGMWNYEPGRNTASGTAIPLPTDTIIWGESSLGGVPGVGEFKNR
jgi:hypothetical protein